MTLLAISLLLTAAPSMAETFDYFAYGSNLLANRIHVNNPTAVRAGIGKLENYRLDFIRFARYWRGAIATIVPTENDTVWGAIWEISLVDLPKLDRQEGVASGAYVVLNVDVVLLDGGRRKCRTYMQSAVPEQRVSLKYLPMERRPSWIYLKTIITGAAESGLPEDYQEFLKAIPHNGYADEEDIVFSLSKTQCSTESVANTQDRQKLS